MKESLDNKKTKSLGKNLLQKFDDAEQRKSQLSNRRKNLNTTIH